MAAAGATIDREASGWFESAGPQPGGPTVQRRVDRRTKRMDAYPPIDRKSRTATQAPGSGPAGVQGPGTGGAAGDQAGGGEARRNGQDAHAARKPDAQGGPPTDQDAGP